MDKKTLIKHLLEKLKPHRDLAEWFLVIFQSLDDTSLENQFLDIITSALHQSLQKQKSKQLTQAQHIIHKIRSTEQRKIEQQEADDLLSQLE